MSSYMTAGALRTALDGVPDDVPIAMVMDGAYQYASVVDVGSVDYSAGPGKPVQETRVEVTIQ